MKILYIGQYQSGGTSRMRGEVIQSLFPDSDFFFIDTSIPFDLGTRLLRSLAFRYKIGPLIGKINRYIQKEIDKLHKAQFDLIWVDKAVFITAKTTKVLRQLTNKLVHFTPDPAFTYHRSQHFRASLSLYDYAITTKAYELKYFEEFLKKDCIIYATQGFDKNLHCPQTKFANKKEGLLFIGHYEDERERFLQKLIDNSISVTIAGIKWEKFAAKNIANQNLHYLGAGIYGPAYAKALSDYQFSWGALSKWIPEQHTTRTFEIPACGTALITERNPETNTFFNEDEAIFYDNINEMIEKIQYYLKHPFELEQLTGRGMLRVQNDGRDYESILRTILTKMEF